MGVDVLLPQDCLKQSFPHMKYPRNPTSCPNKQKRAPSNRTRRSPPRNQTTIYSSPPVAPPLPSRAAVSTFVPKGTVKKTSNNNLVAGQVKILKRGEEIPKINVDLTVQKPDLGYTRRIGPDPETIPIQIRPPTRKSKVVPLYAGPVTMTSPPPSDVPLPGFFASKKSVSLFQAADATNDLIRILRLDIA